MNPYEYAEQLFRCEQGERGAYHGDLRYVTLGFQSQGVRAKEKVEARMCAELHEIRWSLPVRPRPRLFWRFDDCVETVKERGNWYCRTRIAVPGVNWAKFTTKPEGAPYPQVK